MGQSMVSLPKIPCCITYLFQINELNFLDEKPTVWALEEPDDMERVEAIGAGIIALGNRELFEENLQVMPVNTPSYRHQRAISTTAEARKKSKRGYIENHATSSLAKRYAYGGN